MRHVFIVYAVASIVGLGSCTGGQSTLAPGLALELTFENALVPNAMRELDAQAPPPAIAFCDGIEGRAARFDGSGAALQLRGVDRLQIGRALTVEFFVNFADWSNPYGPGGGLESVVSHSDIFTVAVDPHAWKLQARVKTDASEEAVRLHGGHVRTGAWHHVALVLDDARSQARLVLDGEVVSDVPVQGNVAIRANLELVIGTWFQKNQAFCGALDSLRIWNRALSEQEIRARAALLPRASSS
ncbi:MAG: LamG domain-containing protein [Planctomycetota bacterium]